MSKASDFKKHSDLMRFDNGNRDREPRLYAHIFNDGTLNIAVSSSGMMGSGISPKEALALGKWIVEMFEDSSEF